jgi:hypothetical protein
MNEGRVMEDAFNVENELDLIIDYGEYPRFLGSGTEDQNGFQVFTPSFIVNDMMNVIGLMNISDISKTVLEPASGDGAFTARILEARLERLEKTKSYLQKSLQAISTIYSIEMDKNLVLRQRNNLFTLLLFYARKYSVSVNDTYITSAKKIIYENIIWGETNIREEWKNSGIIGWHLPIPFSATNRHKETLNYAKAKEIQFTRWDIKNDCTLGSHLEDAEFDHSVDISSLGGLFDESNK